MLELGQPKHHGGLDDGRHFTPQPLALPVATTRSNATRAAFSGKVKIRILIPRVEVALSTLGIPTRR